MKKILLFNLMMVVIAATVSFGFTSCSEDDNSNVSESVLIGKWVHTNDEGTFEFKKDGTLIHERRNGSKLTGIYEVIKIDEEYGTFFTVYTDYNDSYIGLYISYSKSPERLEISGLRDDSNLSHVLFGSYKRQ